MAETVEIIPTKQAESELDQPLPATNKLYREISLISGIYQWQSTGIRVIVNLPVVGDDRTPLFIIRASPFIPHLVDDTTMRSQGYYIRMSQNLALVGFLPDFTAFNLNNFVNSTDLSSTHPVTVVTHSLPPLISTLAKCYRFWKGGLDFKLRTKASFTHNAILMATILRNVKSLYVRTNPTDKVTWIRPKDPYSFLSPMANSHQYLDLSMNRHLEINVPYEKPVPYVDQFAIQSLIMNTTPQQTTIGDGSLGLTVPQEYAPSPWTDDFVAIYPRGGIENSSSGTNQIEFEIDIKAAADFQFFGENICLAPQSDTNVAMYGTYANTTPAGQTVPSGRAIIPRKYTNPMFQSGNSTVQFSYEHASDRLITATAWTQQ